MHLLVTRPEPDATELKVRLEAMGHRASLCPLFEIEYVPPASFKLDGVQALIATSRNAVRSLTGHEGSGHRDMERLRALPLFIVGPGTAAEARASGFEHVIEGPAAARDLIPLISARLSPQGGALLHLAGDVLAFDLKSALEAEGFAAHMELVYRTRPVQRLAPAVVEAVRAGEVDGVILLSPRAAREFSRLVAGAGLAGAARDLACFCMSEAVANSLEELAPQDVRVARLPNMEEVLALLAQGAPESAGSDD